MREFMNSPATEFNPYNIRQADMSRLADILEDYIDELETVMIFPDDTPKQEMEAMSEAIHRTKKLIKKLRKGDKSVFRDPTDVDEEAMESIGSGSLF